MTDYAINVLITLSVLLIGSSIGWSLREILHQMQVNRIQHDLKIIIDYTKSLEVKVKDMP